MAITDKEKEFENGNFYFNPLYIGVIENQWIDSTNFKTTNIICVRFVPKAMKLT